MSVLIDAAEVIEREGVRLKALIDAAAVLRDNGSLQQAADEATKRRDDMTAEVMALSTQLITLHQDVADATDKASRIVSVAQAQADTVVSEANMAAAAAAQEYMVKATADVRTQTQSAVDASNQAVLAAQSNLEDLTGQIAALEKDAADRRAVIQKMQSDKDGLEAALAALKAKFQ